LMGLRENVSKGKTDRLFNAILTLKDVDELYAFFEDLCTIPEVSELGDRLDIAVMLSKGSTYAEVGKETGASSATVSRVKRFLSFGAGGYRTAIARLEEKGLL